jgi:hypothetical protein
MEGGGEAEGREEYAGLTDDGSTGSLLGRIGRAQHQQSNVHLRVSALRGVPHTHTTTYGLHIVLICARQ